MKATAARSEIRIAEPGLLPLDFAIQDFLHAKATRAAKTVQFYALALKLYRAHVSNRFWPPTDSSINSFLASVKERGCKAGTVHAYYRALRCWCNWLHRRGKIEENPMDLVEEPPQSRALPRAPSAASLQRLFKILNIGAQLGRWNHVRDLALFGLLYDAGLRVGEAVSLEIDDLNLHYGTATIRETKTGTDRVIVYDEETANDLHRWLKVRGTMDLPPGLRAVFVSRHWQRVGPLTPSGVRLALRRWCTRAGIPSINPHALRHAYAVHTLRNGGNLLDVQRQLGHRNLSTTQRYTQIVDAGRRLRHAQHSPRTNLDRTAAEEKEST